MLNLLGVIIAFIIIIILIRKRYKYIDFGVSLIIGSLVVGIFALQEIQLIDIPKAIIEASIYSFKTGEVVTQTVELFNGTLRDNITLFDETILDQTVLQVIKDIGLEYWFTRLGAGLDTKISATNSFQLVKPN